MRCNRPANLAVNASHSAVTARAYCGTRRASRPAGYRERWTGSDQDFPESGFGRIFSGTK
jgi:hypothetical protein